MNWFPTFLLACVCLLKFNTFVYPLHTFLASSDVFSSILLYLKAFYEALLQISFVLLISFLGWSSHLVQTLIFTLIQKAFNSLNANIFCNIISY